MMTLRYEEIIFGTITRGFIKISTEPPYYNIRDWSDYNLFTDVFGHDGRYVCGKYTMNKKTDIKGHPILITTSLFGCAILGSRIECGDTHMEVRYLSRPRAINLMGYLRRGHT